MPSEFFSRYVKQHYPLMWIGGLYASRVRKQDFIKDDVVRPIKVFDIIKTPLAWKPPEPRARYLVFYTNKPAYFLADDGNNYMGYLSCVMIPGAVEVHRLGSPHIRSIKLRVIEIHQHKTINEAMLNTVIIKKRIENDINSKPGNIAIVLAIPK
jgi:hypothetical protein